MTPPQEGSGPVPRKRRPLTVPPRDVALDTLKRRQKSWATVDRHRSEAVALARAAGVPWSEIGAATGLTPDGARSKWGRLRRR